MHQQSQAVIKHKSGELYQVRVVLVSCKSQPFTGIVGFYFYWLLPSGKN
jgi:hypothetical protein